MNIQVKYLYNAIVLLLCIILGSCAESNNAQRSVDASFIAVVQKEEARIVPKYAKGFNVTYKDNGVRLVDLKDPQSADALNYHFALVPRGASKESVPEGYEVVEVPVRSAVFMTTLQLSNAIALGNYDIVGGVTSTNNLFDETIAKRLAEGKTMRIGKEGNFDTEKIIATQPDVIFISPFKRGGYDAIKEVGVQLIPHLGYKELDPLGQAEWVKFIAMFSGDEVKANRLFSGIVTRYNAVKEKVAREVKVRPTVFSGEMHNGNWYAVGGRNYLAKIFTDAGADYILKDNDDTGGVNLDFESLYAKAANADYWRILNSYSGDFTYEALRISEPRNEEFKAFRERKVIYCNMLTTPYYESATMNPDRVLQDFVNIFHPGILDKGYEPGYYKLLK